MKRTADEEQNNDIGIPDSKRKKTLTTVDAQDNDEKKSKKKLTFCYYVTGHGYGHATRVVDICRNLLQMGHRVIVSTAVPEFVFTRELDSIEVRKVVLDKGAVQADPLSVDPVASLELYKKTAVNERQQHIDTEVKFLKSVNADVVVVDIVPLGCAAAKQAGCKLAVCTNFSWDFVFSEYLLFASQSYRDIVNQIAEDYSQADVLLRLPGYCPMPAFKKVIDVPLVVRRARKTPEQVRADLGISNDTKLLMFNFGGQAGTFKLKDSFLPPGWRCLVCTMLPIETAEGNSNFIRTGRDEYIPDLIQACDVVLGKIGYGMTSEALGHSTPFVFIRREWFNEEPFLRRLLYKHGLALEMSSYDFYRGAWTKHLNKAYAMKQKVSKVGPPPGVDCNGGQVVAKLLENLGKGDGTIKEKPVEGERLRDAIVYGFLMKVGRTLDDHEVGQWYENIQSMRSFTPPVRASDQEQFPFHGFELLMGNTCHLKDVHQFLGILAESAKTIEINDDPALKYAQTMFDWSQMIYIGRAPGRLDVMGGIADYSGSLVLQMPIKEACKVAIQLLSDTEIHIASIGSRELGRRSNWHGDIKLLLDEAGNLLPYKDIAAIFKPAHDKWAAYVVGVIVVLLKEKNIKLKTGFSIFINSNIPEDKGLASSAALEVATMYAAAPAFGVMVEGREIAFLCQKAEHHIALQPCGIMDQMTCVFGKKDKLLALLCQPAEVEGYIDVPSHVRFWGIDSGIACRSSSLDFNNARVGAFMGRRIMFGENSKKYLANVPPSESRSKNTVSLPITITGEEFRKKYGSHDDPATIIKNPQTEYSVRYPTNHPIEENFRVRLFQNILRAMASKEQFSLLGELMYQSHLAYSTCGLGSDGTDQMVNIVRQMGASHGLFGAKITGGGLGGAVCVLGSRLGETSISELIVKYEKQTGYKPCVFTGSSCGAGKFGHIVVRLKDNDSKT